MTSSPSNRFLVEGQPAGPLFSYFNNDSWTDEPFAPGVVLTGDAAGWNDPIVGLGLSITYRDVRIVSDILKAAPDWAHADFRPFGEERRERMRRLRFAAHLQAALDMEFGTRARARRQRYHDMMLTDPSIGLHGMAVMAGPETAPAEIFTPEHRARVLGEEVTA
jgi:2-polyprenyl-6-methoxyphenol hydroxylase-like FAD-dependent oxidoreductase